MNSAANLPGHAEVIVIGGGIMGCSTLYHLAKQGVSGAILLEGKQLTAGTTWHSAAQVRQLRSTRNLTRLIQYSAKLYAELEAETGQPTGWTQTGSLSIATNPDRWTHVRRQTALARAYGVETRELTLEEVRSMWPLLNTTDLVGAVYSPHDGRVNPSDLCLALSKGARAAGAKIYENTPVTGFLRHAGRIAGVTTDAGEVRADKVVLCGGLWSRDLAAKAGVVAPLLPCEHFYLLTQPMDGIDGQLPTLSDHDSHLYIRNEVGGLLIGCFEPDGKPLRPSDLGEDYAFTLLNEDWDHFEPMMRNALHRIPALETAQVKTLLNGPESFTPDSVFMLGESAQMPGLFLGCGMNSVGVASGGGAGWALAQWTITGRPPFYLGDADPNRFHASENTLDGLMKRAPEVLGCHYEIGYPGRQWMTARNLRLTPLHAQHVSAGARFGQVFGWERPQYFAATAPPHLTYGKPDWFDQVGAEVRAASEQAAVFDQSTFGKIRITGPGAETFLCRVRCNNMARPPGRAIYTAMLNTNGGYESDFTALRLTPNEYVLYVGTGSVKRDMAWLLAQRSPAEEVNIDDVTEEHAVLALMGPQGAAIAAQLGAPELNALGYFRHAEALLAGVPVRAARLSYVGEAGWELTCDVNDATRLYDALTAAGAQPAGLFAQSSMRIEKRFLAMGHDLDPDVTPIEAGLEFALKPGGQYIGHQAVAARREAGAIRRMATVVLDDPHAQPLGDEPVYYNGALSGQATSAAFGYRVGRPVILAYLSAEHLGAAGEVSVEVDLGGELHPGKTSLHAAYDPAGDRMRAT